MSRSVEYFVLTPQEMAAADRAAAASGLPVADLMERAGAAVAAATLKHFPQAQRFVILCGPGNNGGDGYVACRYLVDAGAECALYHVGPVDRLAGAALAARRACSISSRTLDLYEPADGDVIIDAVFGAGLARDVPAELARVISAVTAKKIPVLAVDLPSGLCGRRGVELGASFAAMVTVTFMAPKPGHLLLPGKSLCGDLEVFDIGIPARMIASVAGDIRKNHTDLWRDALPVLSAASHKYRRGHLAVFSGPADRTGAARLSATAGLRSGAGLVTIAAPAGAMAVAEASLAAVMLKQVDDTGDLADWLAAARLHAFVLGPGFGVGARAREFVRLLKDRMLVLDADGITSFREDPQELFDLFAGKDVRLVMTPHEGEFGRLFPDLVHRDDLGKVEKSVAAARRANAVIVYKGADSVIASPDGRAYINADAPAWLATAGSGDVLAGMIGALLAQGMPAFEAAAAGVYLHGAAGHSAGRGLTAEDLAAHAGAGLNAIL